MFYTLSTWAVWMAGAALIGVMVGWLLRSVRPRVVTVIKEVSVDGTPRGSRRPAAVSANMEASLLLGDAEPSADAAALEAERTKVDALEREVAAWKAEAQRQIDRAAQAEKYAAAAKADWEAQLEAAHAAATAGSGTPMAAQRPVVVESVVESADVAAVRAERDVLAGEVVTLRAAVQEMRVRLWNADARIAALRDAPPTT